MSSHRRLPIADRIENATKVLVAIVIIALVGFIYHGTSKQFNEAEYSVAYVIKDHSCVASHCYVKAVTDGDSEVRRYPTSQYPWLEGDIGYKQCRVRNGKSDCFEYLYPKHEGQLTKYSYGGKVLNNKCAESIACIMAETKTE